MVRKREGLRAGSPPWCSASRASSQARIHHQQTAHDAPCAPYDDDPPLPSRHETGAHGLLLRPRRFRSQPQHRRCAQSPATLPCIHLPAPVLMFCSLQASVCPHARRIAAPLSAAPYPLRANWRAKRRNLRTAIPRLRTPPASAVLRLPLTLDLQARRRRPHSTSTNPNPNTVYLPLPTQSLGHAPLRHFALP
jgi:hypothetical protein